MKIIFLGCRKSGPVLEPHEHEFSPWYGTCYLNADRNRLLRADDGSPGNPGSPAGSLFGRFIPGRMEALYLHGDYDVTLEFTDTELKSWLEDYIKHNPEKAIDLLVEMLPGAVEKLKVKMEKETAQ